MAELTIGVHTLSYREFDTPIHHFSVINLPNSPQGWPRSQLKLVVFSGIQSHNGSGFRSTMLKL